MILLSVISDVHLASDVLDLICVWIILILLLLVVLALSIETCFVPHVGGSYRVIQLCSDWSSLSHLSDECVCVLLCDGELKVPDEDLLG